MSRMKKFFKNIWRWIINLWKIITEFLSPVLTMAKKVFKKVFGAVVVLSFLVVPFLNNVINHATAHWLWYPALTLILISLVMDWFHKLKPVFDSPIVEFARKWGEALAVFATISVFVFNYYDIDKKWLWIIFVYMAIYTPCFFLSLLVFDVKQNGKDVERHQNAFANVVKNIALYWFLDLFYMSVFNYWIVYIENQTFNTKWLSLQFIFGILSLVIITFNLTQVFLNGQKSMWFFMALELVIALITCGYLIFIIPNCNIQEIVLTIVSALIGGILTLVGVAWTIKDANEKRQEDLLRIDDERKEEERKKHIPYVRIANKEEVTVYGTISKINNIDLEYYEDRNKLTNHKFVSIHSILLFIKNISSNNIILYGVFVDGDYYDFETAVLVETNAVCRIQIGDKAKLYFVDEIQSLSLKISDIYENFYTVDCIINFEDTNEKIEYFTSKKEKFCGKMKRFSIEGCKFPELIKEDE